MPAAEGSAEDDAARTETCRREPERGARRCAPEVGEPAKRRAHARGTRQGDEEEAAREPCRRYTVVAASARRVTLATQRVSMPRA